MTRCERRTEGLTKWSIHNGGMIKNSKLMLLVVYNKKIVWVNASTGPGKVWSGDQVQ